MLVSSCETKLECGHWVARPGHQTPDDAEKATDQERDQILTENITDPEIQEGILRNQTPAKPLSRPSGAPHPEQYPLVFPTEILITQNPPKLRKVSLKVLDSAGAAEQKRGDYRGEREPDENLFTDFSKTQDINGPH